jgi:hypothetical protein
VNYLLDTSAVFHEDADYEMISRFLPELRQHRISASLR